MARRIVGAVWQHQVEYFGGRGHRTLAVDLPGTRRSAVRAGVRPQSSGARRTYARSSKRGLHHSGAVGHSMGGGIALTMALRWPELPLALVLAGSGARLRMRPRRSRRPARRAEASQPGVRVERLIELDEVVSPSATEETKEWLRARFGECTAQATYGDFEATHHTDLLGQLGGVTQPALVIGGEDDLWTPPRFQEYFGAQLPNVRVHMLPATGHYPFVERPQEFNAELELFLCRVGASGVTPLGPRRCGQTFVRERKRRKRLCCVVLKESVGWCRLLSAKVSMTRPRRTGPSGSSSSRIRRSSSAVGAGVIGTSGGMSRGKPVAARSSSGDTPGMDRPHA